VPWAGGSCDLDSGRCVGFRSVAMLLLSRLTGAMRNCLGEGVRTRPELLAPKSLADFALRFHGNHYSC
jgi:hypothetical protein